MRYVGVDFGTKRVGVALSDESGTLAFPHGVYPNTPELVSELATLARREAATTVVLGESNNFKGEPNRIMPLITRLKEHLEGEGLTVLLEPEYFTSFAAERFQGKRDDIDASAAALILQSYLDKIRT